MNYLKILSALIIGVLTLMSSLTVQAQFNFWEMIHLFNNTTEVSNETTEVFNNTTQVTIELTDIEHQVETNEEEVAGEFHVILKVGNRSDRDILFDEVIRINPDNNFIVTKEVPNNRLANSSRLTYSSLVNARANTRFEASAEAVTVTENFGDFVQRTAPSVHIKETSLNIDEPLEITLIIEDGDKQSTLILKGTITVE